MLYENQIKLLGEPILENYNAIKKWNFLFWLDVIYLNFLGQHHQMIGKVVFSAGIKEKSRVQKDNKFLQT